MIAVEPLPAEFLAQAIDRYTRGEVEGHNGRFCPSTAELCAETRRLKALADYQARPALPKPKSEPEVKISDEERARVIARLSKQFPEWIKPMPGSK